MKNKSKIIWFLEMDNIKKFKKSRLLDGCEVKKLGIPLAIINRFFYTEIGMHWNWVDRLKWDEKDWNIWVNRKNIETWFLLYHGTPAGYFELETKNKEVDIAYFGLLPKFIGKGLGAGFLSIAVEKAWEQNKKKVCVHTCSLDHPNAIKNYKARGFVVYKKIKEIINN